LPPLIFFAGWGLNSSREYDKNSCMRNYSIVSKQDSVEEVFLGRWVALTYRATHSRMAERLKRLGIGYGQFPFLCYLKRCGISSQEEISRALFFDKATTARAVKKLEALGYVSRKVAHEDRRRYEVEITPVGSRVVIEIRSILRDWNRQLTTGFNKEERQIVFDLLMRVAGNAAAGLENPHDLTAEESADGGEL